MVRIEQITASLNRWAGDREAERAKWSKAQEVTEKEREKPIGLTRMAKGRTMVPRNKEAKKENASRGGLILTEMTTKRGAPT